MKNEWPLERLEALAPLKRATLHANAKRLGTPEGDALAQMIEEAGLPFSEAACVSLDDPIVARMREIVFSREGRAAAVSATEEGLPALAGVDPLIARALTVDYGKHNMTTATAGEIVAQLMRHLGYREAGRSAKMPAGCVAQSGMLWTTGRGPGQST